MSNVFIKVNVSRNNNTFFVFVYRTRKNVFSNSKTGEDEGSISTPISESESPLEENVGPREEGTYRKKRRTSEGVYDEACVAVKAAAEAIRQKNLNNTTVNNTNNTMSINEHFVHTVLGLLAPLADHDRDYAFGQIMNLVLEFRKSKLFPNEK